jgi:biopolymer transport protein ExbB
MGEAKIPAFRWMAALLLLASLALLLDAAVPLAQEGPSVGEEVGEPAAPTAARYTEIRGLLDWFQRGGKFMYPLLLCSIIGLAVVIERMISLRRATAHTRRLIGSVLSTLQDHGVGPARERCRMLRLPAARILDSGLARAQEGPARMERVMESAGSIEVAMLQRGLLWLSTVANVTPLLGFLGTVSGMIQAFATIAGADQISARLVAGGIEEALITTETGLAIAIPIQAFHNYFVGRIDRFTTEVEEGSLDLIGIFEAKDRSSAGSGEDRKG